jgi:aspartyl-tRNA(Asn)/glutamyl-tRNA(Gln) amidotransferase subunit A
MKAKFPTLEKLADDLESGRSTSRALVEESLNRIADPQGEGARVFIKVDAAGARAAADYQDDLRKRGRQPSRFSGIPFSVKDLFDIAGEVTTAGSKVLANHPAATKDAKAIAALKAAGFIVLGRTNMTEFAYSGLGMNPHYGTPRISYDRKNGRVPGGSSSGAGVAVADGMCALSIGSDTGGSCRVPAAYNGVVGFKPSTGRVSTVGAFPLSSSFDSVGPLANSVVCCASADALMAGDWDGVINAGPGRPLRLGVLNTVVMDQLDHEVREDFARTMSRLRGAGVEVQTFECDALKKLPMLLKQGGIVGFEALAVHHALIASRGSEYDPRVSGRIALAGATSASDYANLLQECQNLIAVFDVITQGFDAVILPTVANISPRLSDIDSDDSYFRLNGLSLRNTYVVNILDGCAISLPMHLEGHAPTGLMLMASHGKDLSLFSATNAIALLL